MRKCFKFFGNISLNKNLEFDADSYQPSFMMIHQLVILNIRKSIVCIYLHQKWQ